MTVPARQDDEEAIRRLVDAWMQATKAGDTSTVLELMADDVLFLVPGQEPFGKEAFAAASEGQDVAVDGTAEIKELEVTGDWAWMRGHISVTMTPPGGEPVSRAGYTLTILRRTSEGNWVIARDANLLPPGG